LFFHQEQVLGSIVADATHALQTVGMSVTALHTSARFAQLDVRSGVESVVVDLVADPTPITELTQPFVVGTTTIMVETPHQLFVNKLCALLSRSELRDLVDVRALLESGGDLIRALSDCPGQDAGFLPLTFAWGAQGLQLRRVAVAQGWRDQEIEAIERFRDDLVARVIVNPPRIHVAPAAIARQPAALPAARDRLEVLQAVAVGGARCRRGHRSIALIPVVNFVLALGRRRSDQLLAKADSIRLGVRHRRLLAAIGIAAPGRVEVRHRLRAGRCSFGVGPAAGARDQHNKNPSPHRPLLSRTVSRSPRGISLPVASKERG
jgi:hypothetical protein